MSLFCTTCKLNIKGGIYQYKTHMRHNHGISTFKTNRSGYICGQQGCQRNFKVFSALIRHIKSQHTLKDNQIVEDLNNLDNYASCDLQDGDISGTHDEKYKSENKFSWSKAIAKMVADLRSNPSVTGAALNQAVTSCESLLTDHLSYLKEEAQNLFKTLNVSLDSQEVKSFMKKFDIEFPFKSISTIDGQIKILKDHYRFIDPIEVPLGNRIDRVLNVRNDVFEPKIIKETFNYVPIIKTLHLLLSNPQIKNHVDGVETNVKKDVLEDFCDGKVFKNSTFFTKYPRALRIVLYYDDIVINNPLGSKVHPHKLGTFYFTLQNLPKHLLSLLSSINVLAICHTADIQKYGMKAILTPFLEDLKKLESDAGVTVMLDSTPYVIRASLACVCADGLAAHQLFGFLSPSARHFCRMCMTTREQLHAGDHRNFLLRTKSQYEDQLSHVKLNKSMETEYGIREDCALHASRYFHCTSNFIFDPMHDLLEGICPLELKLILKKYIVEMKYFDVSLFNGRVHSFCYGIPESKNKPSANFSLVALRNLKDNALKQSAIQMWCLMRVFPFLVSDKIPEDDKYLCLILLLNRIMEIVFSPKLTLTILPYLDELIKEHEELYRELFPERPPINKHHHLVHYSKCIQQSGPLRHLWCMRFEAKHNMFKKYGTATSNFKNLPKSMARLCQISQCAFWGHKNSDLISKVCTFKGTKTFVKDFLSSKFLFEMGYISSDEVYKTSEAYVHGTRYSVDLFVAIDSGINLSSGDPVFGKIKEIVIFENQQVYLLCEKWETLWLESILNAYRVIQGDGTCFIDVDTLVDFKPLALWFDYKTRESFIALRNILI